MLRALFFNVPAHGHVNPSLPVVRELINRGHEVHYYITEAYQKRVAQTGATVHLYGNIADDYFDAKGLDGSAPQKAALALLETTQAIMPELLKIAEQMQADYIIYDCMCPWGYFLARTLKLPAVSSFSLMPLSPRMMLNPGVFRIMFPMLMTGFWSGIEAFRLSNRLGKIYNVPALDMMSVLSAPGDISISYSSSEFIPFSDSLPGHFRMTGWTMPEIKLDPAFVRDSERPLIYISLGTVINDNIDFFQTCIEALADSPYDVLISTGKGLSPERFGTLPENIRLESWVPQPQVLSDATLFITHGGLNSLHEGMYYNVPLLTVPQQIEQMFNAMRVEKLGAGLMLKPGEVSAETLRQCVESIINQPRYKIAAQRLGESLRNAGGVSRAVDEIENLLK